MDGLSDRKSGDLPGRGTIDIESFGTPSGPLSDGLTHQPRPGIAHPTKPYGMQSCPLNRH